MLFDEELGEKIHALVSEDVGGMVISSYTIAEYIDPETGEQLVFFSTSPGQKETTSAGLLALAGSISDFELRSYVGAMYRGEE